MYIKVDDNKIIKYPYSLTELAADNPQVSLSTEMAIEALADWGVFPVAQTTQPQVDYRSVVAESTPVLIEGQWTQTWDVGTKPQYEIDETNEQLRAEAYRNESDPLFFKYQRDEIEKQVWLDKVAEIKARYS